MDRPRKVNDDQEAVVREFIECVAEFAIPVSQPVMVELYDMLGYRVYPNGARVNKNKQVTHRFGESLNPEDEYYDDWQRMTDAEIEDTNTSESGTSEQAESPSVG